MHFDVGVSVHRSPKCDLEEWPASPDRHERLIAGLRVAGQKLVLAILQRPEIEDCIVDIGCFFEEHAPSEAEEVVRLAEVGYPRALPVIEEFVRAAPAFDRPVALEHGHSPPALSESDGSRQTRYSTAQHRDVRSRL